MFGNGDINDRPVLHSPSGIAGIQQRYLQVGHRAYGLCFDSGDR